MSTSTIKITFTEDLPIGAQLGFDVNNDGGQWGVPTSVSQIFNWVNLRSSNNQVTTGTPTLIVGERAAINFVIAFNLDTGGMYVVTRTNNEVLIKAPNINSYTSFFVGGIFAPYVNHPSIEFDINNGSEIQFNLVSIDYSSATNPCTHVSVTIETTELATKVLNPIVINPNEDNPISFEYPRGQFFSLQLENENGDTINQIVETPNLLNLNPDNFTIQINGSPNGSTAIFILQSAQGLTTEYSLDNVVWQSSNIFTGLPAGDYTVFIRDNFGCQKSREFNVDEYGINNAYFYISKSNSFRFANRIAWGDSENYKNDENTLSCEADVELAYKEIQQFQSADVIITQFKSNYPIRTAKVVKEDDSEVVLPIIQKTNNIGIKDKRDAFKYNLGDGKTGVYFVSGTVYDYDTETVTGSYSLNGLLPEWAQIGNYIQISSIWYLIENIVFDESRNAEILVISNIYNGPEEEIIAASIYNRFNYEVYEFTIDMVDYIDQKFRVKLENSSPNFTTLIHLSELIWCKVKHEKVLEIRYRNNTNTDILYSTGIEHKIRIPFLFIKGKSDGGSENHKTDTDVILLNADLYEGDDIQFEPVTKEIWRKIMLALSHEKVAINGVGYVKNGDFTTEGPLERSNLYSLTASMIKTGSVYNSQTSGNLDFDGSEVEVPGLISTESGYLGY